jgi:hypothetical protein
LEFGRRLGTSSELGEEERRGKKVLKKWVTGGPGPDGREDTRTCERERSPNPIRRPLRCGRLAPSTRRRIGPAHLSFLPFLFSFFFFFLHVYSFLGFFFSYFLFSFPIFISVFSFKKV